jgi:hypothetical protein
VGPRHSPSNISDSRRADIEFARQHDFGLVGIEKDDVDQRFGEPCSTVALTDSCAATNISISNVVGLASKLEVCDLNTQREVARVAHDFSSGDGTLVPNPNEGADEPTLSSDTKAGVSVWIEVSCPFKTSGRKSSALIYDPFEDRGARGPFVADLRELDLGEMCSSHTPMNMPNFAGLSKCDSISAFRR